jgi:hypothetical protein
MGHTSGFESGVCWEPLDAAGGLEEGVNESAPLTALCTAIAVPLRSGYSSKSSQWRTALQASISRYGITVYINEWVLRPAPQVFSAELLFEPSAWFNAAFFYLVVTMTPRLTVAYRTTLVRNLNSRIAEPLNQHVTMAVLVVALICDYATVDRAVYDLSYK